MDYIEKLELSIQQINDIDNSISIELNKDIRKINIKKLDSLTNTNKILNEKLNRILKISYIMNNIENLELSIRQISNVNNLILKELNKNIKEINTEELEKHTNISKQLNDKLKEELEKLTNKKLNKKKKIDYDFFIVKCKMNSIIKDLDLNFIIEKHTIDLNEIFFATYYLFNIYVYELLENNKVGNKMSRVTIQRCCNILFNGNFRNEDQEITDLTNIYTKYKQYFDLLNLPKMDSINPVVEQFSEQIFTNILNHYCLNFYRFQQKYLIFKLEQWIGNGYSEKLLAYLTRKCQQAINENSSSFCLALDPKRKENQKINQLELEEKLKAFIDNEQKLLPEKLLGKITKTNIKENLWDTIIYFRLMLDKLEENSLKRFDLLPQLSLGVHNIRLGSRYLCVIYNEWKNNNSKNNIKIKEFEKNYEKYYAEMFNLQYFDKRKDINSIPISFLTDGVSICSMFRKIKRITNKSDNQSKIIDIEKENITKGLYE